VMGWTCSLDRTSEKHTGGQGPLGKLRQTEIWIGLNLLRIMLLCFRHLSHSLGVLDAVFTSDRQQDATEFLVRLLDLFREHFSSSNLDYGVEGWYFLTH
jgi:hypothetical protein